MEELIFDGEQIFHNERHLKYNDVTFSGSFTINKGVKQITLRNCKFISDFVINGKIEGRVRIIGCTFLSEFHISGASFMNKTKIQECVFNETYFSNTKFYELIDFWGSTFKNKVIFYKTDFRAIAVFSTAIFEENVLFTYSLIEKLAIFRGTVFQKGLDLSLAIIGGDLGLYDLKLKDYDSIESFIPENEYDRIVSIIGDIPARNKRETFRVLKKYHIDQKNPVEYEDFSLLESISHRREVWRRLKSEQRRWKDFWDYSLLTLNRVSNKHKTNYWRGFLFTVIIGWVFFYFALITTELISIDINPFNWNLDDFSLCAKHYFISLTPTHKYTYMDELKPNSWFYLWDFLGRLFIAYGIYQSVQAFRKFK